MPNPVYGNYIRDLHDSFVRRLDYIAAEYNFDLGDEFEIAICEILSEFLPAKYGVCRGFAVSCDGRKQGDDIIIYDKSRFPTLRTRPIRAFERKENIPIEAIYAYIEAKHTLTKDSLVKSLAQVKAVKQLCACRESVALQPPYSLPNWPPVQNPIFGMVLSRYCVGLDGRTQSTCPSDVEDFLSGFLQTIRMDDYLPDLIICGPDNLLTPSYVDKSGKNYGTIHYIPGVTTGYRSLVEPRIAFGAGLACLGGAVDWALLGKMPWLRIINETLFPFP